MVRPFVPLCALAAALAAGCGGQSSAGDGGGEHAVIVHLASTDFDAMVQIEDRLVEAIEDAGVGEYDGNEVAVDGSEAIFYAYGPDADALWNVMRPVIEEASPPPGSFAIKRYGEADDPSAKEIRIEL